MSEFKNKVAIITASSTGIGLAIAQRLAKEGASVIVSSRSKVHVDKAVADIQAKGGEAYGIICHVGNKGDRTKLIEQTIKKYGKIDMLVCNAAVSTQMGNFLEANESQINKMWDINFKSTFFLVQQALPHLRKQKNASILLLASYTAYQLDGLIGHYALTKTALVGLTKILAKQLINDNIRVNCLAPGIIKTKFSGSLWQGREKETIQTLGITRLGQVQDIANSARFLLSLESSYITGESLFVAGKPSSRL